MNVGEISATLTLNASQWNSQFQQIQGNMQQMAGSAQQVSRDMDKVGAAALAMGTVIASSIAASVTVAANFEQKMKDIESVSGATGAEMEQLGDLAKEMGQKTAFSASEAAMGREMPPCLVIGERKFRELLGT